MGGRGAKSHSSNHSRIKTVGGVKSIGQAKDFDMDVRSAKGEKHTQLIRQIFKQRYADLPVLTEMPARSTKNAIRTYYDKNNKNAVYTLHRHGSLFDSEKAQYFWLMETR